MHETNNPPLLVPQGGSGGPPGEEYGELAPLPTRVLLRSGWVQPAKIPVANFRKCWMPLFSGDPNVGGGGGQQPGGSGGEGRLLKGGEVLDDARDS